MSEDAPPSASEGIQGKRKVRTQEHQGFEWEWNWKDQGRQEKTDINLSFGLLLFDEVTETLLQGSPEITLDEIDNEPVRTPSGYYAFNDIPAELDAVHLRVDAGEEYFVEERTVILDPEQSAHEPDDPGVEVVQDKTEGIRIDLSPTPAYEFPRTYTHVRGHVYGPEGEALEGATVSMPEFDVETRTVRKGEYALYVPVTSENVHRTNGKKYVKLNGAAKGNGNGNGTNGTPIGTNGHLSDPTVEVSHPDHGSVEATVEMEAGTRAVYHVTLD